MISVESVPAGLVHLGNITSLQSRFPIHVTFVLHLQLLGIRRMYIRAIRSSKQHPVVCFVVHLPSARDPTRLILQHVSVEGCE